MVRTLASIAGALGSIPDQELKKKKKQVGVVG